MITVAGRVALRAMAVAGEDARVLDGVRRLASLLAEINVQPDGRAAFDALSRYILATHEAARRSARARR